MRIYKMTATFGKLEHQSLSLQPGLNVITAPNEWGKSTWCAFLVAMLYGLDTRAKSTKNTLADKERFAPWSGSPMEGRIDLNWQGRDITIERRTRRRVPLGEFRAYETESGLPVNELTAANCGQMLLGVEQSVFRRAGFIRHSDLPMTQDEALRRRLNALVTTGDESGRADRLAASLKDLKNRCRYNRSGLLPQAEGERDALEARLNELEALQAQSANLRTQLEDVKNWLDQLHNHQQALAYAKMEADLERVAQAREALEQAEQTLRSCEERCAGLPPRETAQENMRQVRAFREQWNAFQLECGNLPQQPEEPKLKAPFAGMTPEAALEMTRKDAKLYHALARSKLTGVLVAAGILGLVASAGLVYLRAYWFAAAAAVTAVVCLIWGIFEKGSMGRQAQTLREKYGSGNSQRWADPIGEYQSLANAYRIARKQYQDAANDLDVRRMVLCKKREELCGDREPGQVLEFWQEAVNSWDAYYTARRDAGSARSHFEALRDMVKPVEKPARKDNLDKTEAQTRTLLVECETEQQRLQNRLGQYQGRIGALGDAQELRRQLEQKNKRIARLNDTYAALVIAQETLTQAQAELQRRFAPRITKRAQKLLAQMTGGRYHSVTMGEDFSLQAGAGEEDTLHDALWRSDGTMDQLYLALRLAVAEELTPDTPLILDDVLVRFDDQRMEAAMGILKEMAKQKQIICFTCQDREGKV